MVALTDATAEKFSVLVNTHVLLHGYICVSALLDLFATGEGGRCWLA